MKPFGGRAQYGTIIDIHSGSVGIAIVDLRDDQKDAPTIIFSHREYLKVIASPTPENIRRELRSALLALGLAYTGEGLKTLRSHDSKGTIGKLLIVCGAPWSKTSTRFIKVEDPVPFVVTPERIQSLIEEVEAKDESELKASTVLKDLNVSLIERSIIHTSINGYLTPEPYGKKATELSLAHISGVAPKELVSLMREIEDKVIPPHITRVTHTFALVAFCVVRDRYPEIPHGIIVDVSAEATEILLMQDEMLVESMVLPYGAHTCIRDVARALKTFPEEALAHIHEYSEASPQKIKKAITAVQATYTEELTRAFNDLKTRYVLPHHFFLSTSKDPALFVHQLLLSATEIYRGNHGTFVSLNDELKEADAFFAIESRFFKKRHGCGEITK